MTVYLDCVSTFSSFWMVNRRLGIDDLNGFINNTKFKLQKMTLIFSHTINDTYLQHLSFCPVNASSSCSGFPFFYSLLTAVLGHLLYLLYLTLSLMILDISLNKVWLCAFVCWPLCKNICLVALVGDKQSKPLHKEGMGRTLACQSTDFSS